MSSPAPTPIDSYRDLRPRFSKRADETSLPMATAAPGYKETPFEHENTGTAVVSIEHIAKKAAASLSAQDLYPVRSAFSQHHITALRFLTLASGRIKRAVEALEESDSISMALELQRFQVTLPHLFACRSL